MQTKLPKIYHSPASLLKIHLSVIRNAMRTKAIERTVIVEEILISDNLLLELSHGNVNRTTCAVELSRNHVSNFGKAENRTRK